MDRLSEAARHWAERAAKNTAGIAQIRHKALTQGVATLTVVHEFGG